MFYALACFVSSISNVSIAGGGNTSIFVDTYSLFVALNPEGFTGVLIDPYTSQKITFLGNSSKYIVNVTYYHTYIRVFNYGQNTKTFFYSVFSYDNCVTMDIFINPPNNHKFRVSVYESSQVDDNITMDNNQKFCFFYTGAYSYTISLQTGGVEFYDKLYYNDIALTGYNSDIYYFVDEFNVVWYTDSSVTSGYATYYLSSQSKKNPGLPTNEIKPMLSNVLCIATPYCPWITLSNITRRTDPAISYTSLWPGFCVCAIILIVIFYSIYRSKTKNSRANNGGNCSGVVSNNETPVVLYTPGNNETEGCAFNHPIPQSQNYNQYSGMSQYQQTPYEYTNNHNPYNDNYHTYQKEIQYPIK